MELSRDLWSRLSPALRAQIKSAEETNRKKAACQPEWHAAVVPEIHFLRRQGKSFSLIGDDLEGTRLEDRRVTVGARTIRAYAAELYALLTKLAQTLTAYRDAKARR